MSTLVIILILWWIAEKVDIIRQRKRVQRIQAEQQRQRAEQTRLRQQQAQQAREQERIRKEQTRQAEILNKHEAQIMRLEQRIALAEREIEHYTPMFEELEQKARELDNRIWWYQKNGLPCQGIKDQLEKIKAKSYSIETKIVKAQQTKAFCQKQIAA